MGGQNEADMNAKWGGQNEADMCPSDLRFVLIGLHIRR